VHAKYYGWRYAAYLSMLLYVCMVAAGITVHYAFALQGSSLRRGRRYRKWCALKLITRSFSISHLGYSRHGLPSSTFRGGNPGGEPASGIR
jgi:hypothetical protein